MGSDFTDLDVAEAYFLERQEKSMVIDNNGPKFQIGEGCYWTRSRLNSPLEE